MEHTIKYYPVGNADCTLIKLDNGMTIIVDCQILSDLTDGKGKQINYDVKADLLKELKKDTSGRPYVDLFISTHPHDDHCKGFEDNFYHGKIDDYDKDKNKNEIIIEELWITPRGLKNNLADTAVAVRKEAKRRKELYDDNPDFKGSRGNYLRIIGYDQDKEFDSRYCYVPGKVITSAHGSSFSWLEIFIHAPFKEDVETSKKYDDKNATSIVVQFWFKVEIAGEVYYKTRVLMGGDAEHDIWQHILDNNSDDEKLKWNIFLSPHHCSWSFFNVSDNKKEILPSAETILDKQISSSSNAVASEFFFKIFNPRSKSLAVLIWSSILPVPRPLAFADTSAASFISSLYLVNVVVPIVVPPVDPAKKLIALVIPEPQSKDKCSD